MKKFIKSKIQNLILSLYPDFKLEGLNSQAIQRQLLFHYQFLKQQKLPLSDFRDTGFRVYSQNDEDGLLLFIVALIGLTNRLCVDMAFGSPYGANTTNLICNWGFHGLLIEGNRDNIQASEKFFATHKDTWIYPPRCVSAWVTTENVNEILIENGFEGEIDLFSLDMDGMDYWIWKNLMVVRPRVVIVEYQDIWGPEKAVTVPYKPNFNRFDTHPDYFGASLAAFVKLGREKGYRLVGCNKYCYNAFFLYKDLGAEFLSEVSPESCMNYPKVKWGIENRLPAVRDFEWVEV
jgi:hypothetical protein